MISSSVALFSNGMPVRYDGIFLACCVLFFFSFRRITFLDTLSFLIGSCLPLVLIDGYSQLYKRKNIFHSISISLSFFSSLPCIWLVYNNSRTTKKSRYVPFYSVRWIAIFYVLFPFGCGY
jgi:hypothetical protein